MENEFNSYLETFDPEKLYQTFKEKDMPCFKNNEVELFRLIFPEKVGPDGHITLLVLVYNPSDSTKEMDIILQTQPGFVISSEGNKERLKEIGKGNLFTLRKKLFQVKFRRKIFPKKGIIENFVLVPTTKAGFKRSGGKKLFGKDPVGNYTIIVSLQKKRSMFGNQTKAYDKLQGLTSTVEITE